MFVVILPTCFTSKGVQCFDPLGNMLPISLGEKIQIDELVLHYKKAKLISMTMYIFIALGVY